MSELFAEGPGLNAGAFIARAIGEGMGVTEARNLMRASGLAMSNQTFSNMWGNIRESIGQGDVIAGLDYGAIPPSDLIRQWAVEAGGDYLTFVESQVRLPGTDTLQTRYYTYRTGQPHTPQEAIDAAADFMQQNDAAAVGYGGGTYIGSYVTSFTRAL
jgi:hypothetical protein